ncbi:hypothetical protein G6L41_008785 [Agrobacterium tumefaciens]|uniref:hypothetical protein n=1 Tax=Agrobacterium tumefaciens TaxID=358 RepID=UPI0015729099|nr:hypothetical protein [Agrobacterium tumefaciens]WCK12365.1 hypothetical protein G6L41_008785 [Agrobacterium tumefaciens]
MKTSESTMTLKPISDAARAMLRDVRAAGNKYTIRASFQARALAAELKKAGYVQIDQSGYDLRLTGMGQAYLDRLMRAH